MADLMAHPQESFAAAGEKDVVQAEDLHRLFLDIYREHSSAWFEIFLFLNVEKKLLAVFSEHMIQSLFHYTGNNKICRSLP